MAIGQDGRRPVGRPRTRNGRRWTVKIAEAAYERARLVTAESGESLIDYVTRVVDDRARADLEALAVAVESQARAKMAKIEGLIAGAKGEAS